MSRYMLTKLPDPTSRHDDNEVIVKFSAVTLDDMLTNFEGFLAACGFTLGGSLEVLDPHDTTVDELDMSGGADDDIRGPQ